MMQEILIRKLHDYIRENNPDLLAVLREENRVTEYLRENVDSIDSIITQLLADHRAPSVIEELCMEELTKQLKPSRFNYLKTILEEEYPSYFERLQQYGLLTTELINMITACDAVFDEFNFSATNEDDRQLRYAIMGELDDYLKVTSESGVSNQ
jgi:hypothetical protein